MVKNLPTNAGDYRCGEGSGNPLQCSCLENPMDRGAWWATVLGVAKSQIRRSTHTHTHTHTPVMQTLVRRLKTEAQGVRGVGRGTFMMKKRRRTITTLALGWIHTADRPRLSGSPICFTHVLLSNRVLMASRGISYERRKQKGAVLQGCSVLPFFLERTDSPVSFFMGPFPLFSQGEMASVGKSTYARSLRVTSAVSSFPRGPILV